MHHYIYIYIYNTNYVYIRMVLARTDQIGASALYFVSFRSATVTHILSADSLSAVMFSVHFFSASGLKQCWRSVWPPQTKTVQGLKQHRRNERPIPNPLPPPLLLLFSSPHLSSPARVLVRIRSPPSPGPTTLIPDLIIYTLYIYIYRDICLYVYIILYIYICLYV